MIALSNQRGTKSVSPEEGRQGIPTFDAKPSLADGVTRTGAYAGNPVALMLNIHSAAATAQAARCENLIHQVPPDTELSF